MLTEKTYQIDAVMGWAAGIAEILIQSHGGILHLLPALPVSWRYGRVRGLRVRGGYSVNLEWEAGRLTGGTIDPGDKAGSCKIRYGDTRAELELRAGSSINFDGHLRERQ
jgi:alpha-L-fucosidase 2